MKKKLLIIGAGGHGKVIADIASQVGYKEICFLDDNTTVACCGSYPVVGTVDIAYNGNMDTIVAIGKAEIRQSIQEKLKSAGIYIPTLVHPKTIIARDVKLGAGTVVMAGAIINSGSRIGQGCIINTASSVDHDCVIEDYAHIAVGAHLAGSVYIGSRTWIGAGATVVNNIKITSDSMIGAGAVVIREIVRPGTYIGVPAQRMEKLEEEIMNKNHTGGGISSI